MPCCAPASSARHDVKQSIQSRGRRTCTQRLGDPPDCHRQRLLQAVRVKVHCLRAASAALGLGLQQLTAIPAHIAAEHAWACAVACPALHRHQRQASSRAAPAAPQGSCSAAQRSGGCAHRAALDAHAQLAGAPLQRSKVDAPRGQVAVLLQADDRRHSLLPCSDQAPVYLPELLWLGSRPLWRLCLQRGGVPRRGSTAHAGAHVRRCSQHELTQHIESSTPRLALQKPSQATVTDNVIDMKRKQPARRSTSAVLRSCVPHSRPGATSW
jgi:hypothetical protein